MPDFDVWMQEIMGEGQADINQDDGHLQCKHVGAQVKDGDNLQVGREGLAELGMNLGLACLGGS